MNIITTLYDFNNKIVFNLEGYTAFVRRYELIFETLEQTEDASVYGFTDDLENHFVFHLSTKTDYQYEFPYAVLRGDLSHIISIHPLLERERY